MINQIESTLQRMKKIVFIRQGGIVFFLLVLSVVSYAQPNPGRLYFAPLALLDEVHFPAIQIAYESASSSKWTLFNEVGVKYRNSVMDEADTSHLPSRGFKWNMELRYYFKTISSSSPSKIYGAIGLDDFMEQHNTRVEYYKKPDYMIQYTDVFGVRQTGWGTHLTCGFMKSNRKHLGWEVYAGTGFRFRSNEIIAREVDVNNDYIISAVDLNFPAARNKADLRQDGNWKFRLFGGFRVAWIF